MAKKPAFVDSEMPKAKGASKKGMPMGKTAAPAVGAMSKKSAFPAMMFSKKKK